MVDLQEVQLKIVDEDYNDDWSADDSLTIEDVKRAIQELPEKYKYVVMLYLVEGYDHQEIADILNISEVASRTQLSRGKRKLKELLNTEKNGTES